MATKKAGGSTRNGRDSAGRRLGRKVSDGQKILSGGIIYRQRGTKMLPGKNVGLGKDHTIFAIIDGKVKYRRVVGDRVRISVIAPDSTHSNRGLPLKSSKN